MKLWVKIPLSALIAAFCLILLTGCSPKSIEIAIGDGLFCWDNDVIYAPDELFDMMKRLDLTTLYQHISHGAERDDVRAFLRRCGEQGIGVYLLTGDPSWGLDPEGEDLLHEIDRVNAYNRGLGEGERLLGILADVETYLTDEWERDRRGTMDTWASAMAEARREAQNRGLALLACIPYYLDEGDSASGLETLLREGCDGAAIMNYFRRDESEHISGEVELLGGKPVIVAYELQRPGTAGLTDMNTYHDLGIDAVRQSEAALERDLGGNLKIALHHYRALKELMEDE